MNEYIISDVAQRLLRVNKHEVGVIDAGSAEREVTELARKCLELFGQDISSDAEQTFIENTYQRFQETYSSALWMTMCEILEGAISYGARSIDAEVLDSLNEIRAASASGKWKTKVKEIA